MSPGSFVLRGLLAHTLICPPPKQREAKNVTTCLMLKEQQQQQQRARIRQCVHKHTVAACTPCPLHQSVFPSLSLAYKRVFCSCLTHTESWKMSRTFCLLIGSWHQFASLCLMHIFGVTNSLTTVTYGDTYLSWCRGFKSKQCKVLKKKKGLYRCFFVAWAS